VNPFQVLGLPVRPDLSDAQVRAAWRAIAAQTHPDRLDCGDTGAYTEAANAYAQLRTAWGRSEAYADLAITDPYVPASGPQARWPGQNQWQGLLLIPTRIRHGRPLRLLTRALVAAVLSLLVLVLIPGQPAGPAVVTGLVTWFFFSARADLAAPAGR